MKNISQTLFISLFVSCTSLFAANPKMVTSDWPGFEFALGLDKTDQIPNFNFDFERYKDTIKRFENESVDITFLALYDFINVCRQKPDTFVAIATIDFSEGGDAMIVKPYIKTLQELDGKTIGVQADSLSLWLLHLILKKTDLQLTNINIKDVSAELIDKAFANTKIDAVVGWQPNIANTLEKYPGKIIQSSANFPYAIFDLIVVNKRTLSTHKEAYIDLLKKWFKATTNDAVIAKMAEKHKVTLDEYKTWLKDVHVFHTMEESLKQLPALIENAKEIENFYNTSKKGVPDEVKELFGPVELNIDSLFDFSLLKEAINQENLHR